LFKNISLINTSGVGSPYFPVDGGPGSNRGAYVYIEDSYFKNILVSDMGAAKLLRVTIDNIEMQSSYVEVSGIVTLSGCRIEHCKVLIPLTATISSIQSASGFGIDQILYTITNKGITNTVPKVNYNIDDVSFV